MSDQNKKYRVGLGVCGGIAAYKAIEVLRLLQKEGCEVEVCMSRHAAEFIRPLTFRALSGNYVLIDDYEESNPDPIAHINFSQNIDLFLIVPATANIIGKFANGIADDFISSTYLASHAPVLMAPAMNTTMLEHPATQRNLKKLRDDGVYFIEPSSGELACKTIGAGKLEDVKIIAERALEILSNKKKAETDLTGEKILITTGGTREAIDPVRFISNHSSGKMGFAIAEAAAKRGADVTVVAGAVSVAAPQNVRIINAPSAAGMHKAVMENLPGATSFIGVAAVADYRPKTISDQKIKKTNQDTLTLELEKTADILSDVSEKRHEGLLVVGFAAETHDVISYARSKMERKNLDMIVANDVSNKDTGFGSDMNQATILTRDESLELPLCKKRELADKILDSLLQIRKGGKVKVKRQK